MKKSRLIFILVLCLAFSTAYSQRGKVIEANKAYKNLAYLKTSEILLEVANKGYTSVDLLQKLANSFYFNNQMKEASRWYGELMVLAENEIIDSEYYFRYAQSLKGVENYTESDKWMQKFVDSKSDDLRGKSFASTIDYLSIIENVSRDFEVRNMDLNSEVSDFGAMQYKDQFVFASSRGLGKLYKWNEQPYLELYSVKKQNNGSYNIAEKFGNEINTKYHESTASFTSDDQFMYFTRNNYYKRKYRKDKEGLNRLKIFRATSQDDGSWGGIQSVHFNRSKYSVAHPSVNITDKKLYFASDMPGTFGNSDLYVVDINLDGTLGEPVNLGVLINTEASETFPYVNSIGDLYFSSNGFSGLGGLDVYVVRGFESKYKNHEPFVVENLGRPINSSHDDFGYYENLGTKEGFFTSNRPGGKGDDDIYSFTVPECIQLVEGTVKDKQSNTLLNDAMVTLFDENGRQLQKVTTGENAAFMFDLECEKEYLVRAEKEGYASNEKRFTTPGKKQELQLELVLEKDEKELQLGDDLAKTLNIPIIYFDFDKSNIGPDAALELQKVIAVLNKYPTMTIDVRSHTDSRATYSYNKSLSQRRNKSTIRYIVETGRIDASRLTGKGYGEEQLLNKCSDGIPCSKQEHKLNRRSEFVIVSF